MEIFNAAEEKGLSRCTEKLGGGDDAWEGRSGETAAGDVEGHR